MKQNSLMIQGCTSDAGKSALVTGLCRILRRKGVRVAPFKPQNMALNSAVTIDGGEIGRAQALQAQACGLEPHTDFNPVLLKPNSDTGSQVIVQGKALQNMNVADYHAYKPTVLKYVLESYRRLQEQYDFVVIEGAGSPAEINLRQNDIANMGFAEAVDAPVWLCADIEKGGVFAHLYGTLSLLSDTERKRVAGALINRFRGDKAILQPGLDWWLQKTGKPIIGVLPYIKNLHLDAEDSLCDILTQNNETKNEAIPSGVLNIIVVRLPRISNHTDFEPLRLHPEVELTFTENPPVTGADLVIIPGSKSVAFDMEWLKMNGWQQYLIRHLRYGGKVMGICGGYQMLGKEIRDPHSIEGPLQSVEGLSLLNITTTLETQKRLHRVSGYFCAGRNHSAGEKKVKVEGYEIHAGVSEGPGLKNYAIELDSRTDGAISPDGQVFGTYLHGIFDTQGSMDAILAWAGLNKPGNVDYISIREKAIDTIADEMERHLDLSFLERLI